MDGKSKNCYLGMFSLNVSCNVVPYYFFSIAILFSLPYLIAFLNRRSSHSHFLSPLIIWHSNYFKSRP